MRKLSYEELKKRSYDLDGLKEIPKNPIYVVLENIRSLFNVGSIFRTADALRVTELILTGYTGKPPRKEIDKTALGAVDSVPWQAFDSAKEAINYLRKKGVRIIALEQTESSVDFHAKSFDFPVAVVLGNEFDGIEQETLALCDEAVEIPMFGYKQSLNVGASFGIIGYELVRQLNIPLDE